ERQLAEAQAAQPELAHEAARPPAQLAAVPQPNPVLRRFFLFGYLRGRRHLLPLSVVSGQWSVVSGQEPVVRLAHWQLTTGHWLLNGIPMNCSSLRAS